MFVNSLLFTSENVLFAGYFEVFAKKKAVCRFEGTKYGGLWNAIHIHLRMKDGRICFTDISTICGCVSMSAFQYYKLKCSFSLSEVLS